MSSLNRISRITALCLLAGALSGCAAQSSAQSERPPLLQAGSTSVLAGKYEDAVVSYTDFLAASPGPELMAEGYVGRGNAYFKLGKYDLAEADYRNAVSTTRDRALKAQAMMGMANAVLAGERFDSAEKLYRELLRYYKGLVAQDEVTYRLGLVLARQSKWDESRQLLEEVAANWPSGDYAKFARAKLPSISERFFTVQIGAFTNKAMAESTLSDLKAKGFAGLIEPIDIDGVPGYAVRAGRFTNWQAVTEHADKIKTAGFPTYRLP